MECIRISPQVYNKYLKWLEVSPSDTNYADTDKHQEVKVSRDGTVEASRMGRTSDILTFKFHGLDDWENAKRELALLKEKGGA